MAKDNYYILFKKTKNQIPFGDVVRVLYLLKENNYNIVTDKIYFSFFRQFSKKKNIWYKKIWYKKKENC